MKEMPRSLHYGSATFDDEFQSARRDDGLEVRFTRSESRLLHHMVRNAGRVLSRNQLLDAVSEPGSDKSDRNIDFAINRLRRKLNDSPQDPKFIATRYGEGYIWVAKAASTRPPATAAHVVLGPFHGVNHIGAFKSLATGFGHTFHMRFAKHFGPSRKVVLDPECPPRTSFEDDCPEIAVDFTFLADEDGLECVFHATAFRTGRLLCVVRHRIAEAEGALDDKLTTADALADRIASEIWKSLAVHPETHEPLPLSMHNASASLTGEHMSWQESDRRLRQILTENPNDHAAKLMLATSIHTKYVENGIQLFMSGADTRLVDEDEIEALITECLPFIQDDPFYAIMAAKLLYFIDRGYRRMAVELAENAHRSSTSIAASLAIIGQMRVFLGQFDQGLTSLEQAHELSERESKFQIYVLVLKCQALMAAGDREGLDASLAQLYAGRPQAKFFFEILYTCPDNPAPEALAALQAASEAQARATLMFVHYLSARLFRYDDHRENVLRTPAVLFSSRFGPSVVPEEIAAAVPGLMQSLTSQAGM